MSNFFFLLTELVKTFTTMLNRSVKSEQPCLVVPHIREKTFSFSPLSAMLAMRFLWMAFFRLINFIKNIFCVYWDNHAFAIFYPTNMVYYIDFHMFNQPYILGINLN